jgi:hypothetical protein
MKIKSRKKLINEYLIAIDCYMNQQFLSNSTKEDETQKKHYKNNAFYWETVRDTIENTLIIIDEDYFYYFIKPKGVNRTIENHRYYYNISLKNERS